MRWPSLPDLGRLGSPSKRARRSSGADGGARLMADPAALQSLLGMWREREAAAGAGGRCAGLGACSALLPGAPVVHGACRCSERSPYWLLEVER